MLFAQGLGEYGALTGGGSSRFGDVIDNLEYTIRRADVPTWVLVSVGVFALWFLFFRK